MRKTSKARLTKCKKSQFLGSALVSGYSYIVFMLIIILFFVIIKLDTSVKKATIEQPAVRISSNHALLAYLRMPITLENKDMTLSDLIILWDMDPQRYSESLSNKTVGFLDSMQEPGSPCGYIRIKSTRFFAAKNCDRTKTYQGGEGASKSIITEESARGAKGLPKHYEALLPPLDPTKELIRVYLYSDISKAGVEEGA